MSTASDNDLRAFSSHLARTKAAVDIGLASFLAAERERAVRNDDVAFVARVTSDLAVRGGKRLRAALLAAAFEGFGRARANASNGTSRDGANGANGANGAARVEACMPALVALELLQVYFLVHDDWMDGDDVRRGGQSVPAALRARYGAEKPVAGKASDADAAAILAGDWACALAQTALCGFAGTTLGAAMRSFARMQEAVIMGQLLDVRARENDETADVERTYLLKTGTYTVRGPLELGAILAGADDGAIGAVAAFADPLGVAFQLADDLLSTFGAEKETGKPAFGDLRAGKRTWLVAAAMKDARVRDAARGAFGEATASDAKVKALADAIEACGARVRVEARIASLVKDARAALDALPVGAETKSILSGATRALTERSS
jgi:geranylgeranyl diphosphate synthase type I